MRKRPFGLMSNCLAMKMVRVSIPAVVLLILVGWPFEAMGQFSFKDGAVQVHSFLSEGYAKSAGNNFLTMGTLDGSPAMFEGAVNVSVRLRDNLRISTQAYDHYIGQMGKGQVTLDFALIDYRAKEWLGFRGGQVKTPLGLFNDTQDQSFLYTWALLPQGVYPTDLRSMSIAHQGGDVYGKIRLGKGRGSLDYDAYAGIIPNDPRGGYTLGIVDQGVKMNGGIYGRTEGFDLRYMTPWNGLLFGTSLAYSYRSFNGFLKGVLPASYSTTLDRVMAFYAEYARGHWRFDAEGRSLVRNALVPVPALHATIINDNNESPWFVAGSYRINKWVEVGSYYSQYDGHIYQKPLVTKPFTGPGAGFIHDPVLSARFDLTHFWQLKAETHFMNGYGTNIAHGFYVSSNPQGLVPQTNLLVLKTIWFF